MKKKGSLLIEFLIYFSLCTMILVSLTPVALELMKKTTSIILCNLKS